MGGAVKSDKLFKYYPSDFGKLKVKVNHMDLHFDIFDDYTNANSVLKLTALEDIDSLVLDAKNLDLHSMKCNLCEINFEYKKDDFKIVIAFKRIIKKGESFSLVSENTFKPTKNILEGLYYDETPKGAPPTMITQCQQWGFQRLVPCIDDMTAKCTYITTIIADSRYTNIISNGDVKEPRVSIGNGRDKIVYDNTKTPMATYLFFLGVGTYDTFSKEVEYPDGSKFNIELVVMKGSDPEIAQKALDILYDSILWVYLFTGPEMYRNEPLAKKIRMIIDDRDELKKQGPSEDLDIIREKLKKLCWGLKLGYKYTGSVYREIAMQNSDFGGMENVGNTTISANRIMPYPDMTDPIFEYMFKVTVHEFYHNLNGSEVTGMSPFEIWLNEAVTVHVERWYSAYVFGKNYARLNSVIGLLSPDGGTFALDCGVASMPIEPDGFNDTNELITSITYVKAPEFVRMIETLLGKEKFALALHNYHTKYKHSNATWQDWLSEMEKVAGIDLKKMARGWLKKLEFPIVNASVHYDETSGVANVSLSQSNAKEDPWMFPLRIALIDDSGKSFAEKVEFVDGTDFNSSLEFSKKPAFVSINRGYSFYGKVKLDQSSDELIKQVKFDDDPVCRFLAFYKLADAEKLALLKDPQREVSEEFLNIYWSLISNDKICEEFGSRMCVIFESVEDPEFSHQYGKLYEVKRKIQLAAAKKYESDLKKIYEKYSAEVDELNYVKKSSKEIKRRQVKNMCLALLSKLDKPEIHQLIINQFNSAKNATDKIVALSLYLDSSAKDARKVLEDYLSIASENLVRWESFLSVIGSSDGDDVIELIKWAKMLPNFRIDQANDQRALFCGFVGNKRKSLETVEGRQFTKELMLLMTPINEYTTGHMLSDFGDVDKMHVDYRAECFKILVDLLQEIDGKKYPSVYNTAKRMVTKLPVARAEYEVKYGAVPEF